MSCMEDPSHRFLANRYFIHNQFVDLGNPFEVVVHYLIIGGMTGLDHQDRFLW